MAVMLEDTIKELLKENEENLKCANGGYEKGYAEGFHDALLDLMKRMGIKTDEKYYD